MAGAVCIIVDAVSADILLFSVLDLFLGRGSGDGGVYTTSWVEACRVLSGEKS